jgi:hypothetical protein
VSDRRRATLILGALLVTFAVVRLTLWRSPDSDFDIAGYNIHHLFTGVLLATVAGIPLVLRPGAHGCSMPPAWCSGPGWRWRWTRWST